MDFLDVLRKQAGRFQCPNCGKSLADCQLDLVSRTGTESLIKVTCAHCQDARLIAVSFAAPTETADRPQVLDEPLTDGAPITTDDVLDVRLAIARYQGDLRSLVAESTV